MRRPNNRRRAPNTPVADDDVMVRVPSPDSLSAAWALVLNLGTDRVRAVFARRDDRTTAAPRLRLVAHRRHIAVRGVDEFDWSFVGVIRDDITPTVVDVSAAERQPSPRSVQAGRV